MIVRTTDDQQYGIITSIIKQGKSPLYMVQCYADLPREAGLRKCGVRKSEEGCHAVAVAVEDVVLMGDTRHDKKTGTLLYVYSRYEKSQLFFHANDYDVPAALVQVLETEGCDVEPDVSFDDHVIIHSAEDEEGR